MTRKRRSCKMDKQFMADSMRKMASAVLEECEDSEHGLLYPSRYLSGHLFYPEDVAAMLRHAADMIEREERERRRKKKYEYSVKYISGCGLHCKLSCNTLDEAYSFVRNSIASRKRIYRREIGEWEEVANG